MTGLYAYLIVAAIIMLATVGVAGKRFLELEHFRENPGLFGMTVASVGVIAGIFWPVVLTMCLLVALFRFQKIIK